MTPQRDIGPILERWFVDGVDQMPDRVYLTILDRVEREPQRPSWRLHPWRFPTMPTPIKLVAIGAALLAVLVGGAIFLGGGRAGPGPTPVPTPTATPSPTPTPTQRPASMEVQGDSASWTAVVPVGWTGAGGGRLVAPQGFAGPTGISLGASGAVNVPSDPCDAVGTVSDAASPADVVAALAARDDLVVSDPIDVTLGGLAGVRVDVEMPADLSACGEDFYILFAEPDGSGIPALGPSNRFRVWIVDVEGRPVIFWVSSFPGTPADDQAEAQRIVDSIVITR
jgi:hypothetical protein